MADRKGKLNSLQCHVCFEDYKVNQRIWQCHSGHSICTVCRNRLSECPFCKAPYQGTRNYAIEDIVRELNDRSDQDSDDYTFSSKWKVSQNNCHTFAQLILDPDEFEDMVVVDVPTRVRRPRRYFHNSWINCSSHDIPSNMIVGGRDHGNTPLYIGRAMHGCAVIPGKVNARHKKCYVAWGSKEHEKTYFEILTNVSGTWLPNSGGTIPEEAFPAGHTENGETLYIGRAPIGATLAIGKVHPSHGCCYLSYGGKVYSRRSYEIFVLYP
ncbi:hypothetical protein HA402_005086 [Bradysia odoriphaga]|nr:hypothetical protein HA402_005086 [Bradysia odoriphaga]